MQKLAIVGGGISGLSLAYYLQSDFEITIFEKDKWGGKAYTQKIGDIFSKRELMDF